MTTAVFARAGRMADQVHKEARQLDPARVILTLFALPFFLLGWTLGKICAVLWAAFAWAWVAVQVGWREAMPGRDGDARD